MKGEHERGRESWVPEGSRARLAPDCPIGKKYIVSIWHRLPVPLVHSISNLA